MRKAGTAYPLGKARWKQMTAEGKCWTSRG